DRLLAFGGVNGRKPGCIAVPRAGSDPRFALFGALLFVALLLGELNGRTPPRFWFCAAPGCVMVPWFAKPFVAPFAGTPALGRPIAPLRAAKSPLGRPPAGTAPTWFCCIVCRRFAVCCVNDAGRTILLCVP